MGNETKLSNGSLLIRISASSKFKNFIATQSPQDQPSPRTVNVAAQYRTTMEATNLKHPKLGLIHGKSQGKVVQYLGLKYGNLEHPLGTATLCATLSTNPFDALHYG
jgi:hypothetical protein